MPVSRNTQDSIDLIDDGIGYHLKKAEERILTRNIEDLQHNPQDQKQANDAEHNVKRTHNRVYHISSKFALSSFEAFL